MSAVRPYLARILGWENTSAIERAMYAVGAATTGHAPLVLTGCGEDLTPIARNLHERAFGGVFIQCDPRRRRVGASVRAAANFELGVPALDAAIGGSLCVRGERLPKDFATVRTTAPSRGVRLIICMLHPCVACLCSAIDVPPLSARARDLARVVYEYGHDASLRLGAAFTDQDRRWVLEHSASSFVDIERGTARRLALRVGGSVAKAARMLGMSHVALAQWLGNRDWRGRRSNDDVVAISCRTEPQ